MGQVSPFFLKLAKESLGNCLLLEQGYLSGRKKEQMENLAKGLLGGALR